MEPAKVWTPLILLAVLIGGIFLFRHLDLVDKANADLLTSKGALRMSEEALKARTANLDKLTAAITKANTSLADATGRHDKAALALADAEKLQRKVEGELNYLTNSFPAAIEKVRSGALGTVLPAVSLGDGKKLTQAQIKKIDENGISFIHSEGFGTVPVENLPVELVEQFDLGPNSILRQAEKIKADANKSAEPQSPQSGSNPVAMTPTTTSSKPASSASTVLSADEKKLKSIELQIADMTAKMNAATRNKAAWEAAAEKFAEQAVDAGYRGVPTSKFRTEETKARAQAALALQQINYCEAELSRLSVEVAAFRRSSN